jgi:hypothetical protein
MANNPFAAWKGYLDEIELQAKRIAGFTFGTGAGATPPPTTNVGGFNVNAGATTTGVGALPNGDIIINVNGSVISEDDLVAVIQSGLRSNSLSGKTSDIGRLAGMFG